jgi:hypothetical protein
MGDMAYPVSRVPRVVCRHTSTRTYCRLDPVADLYNTSRQVIMPPRWIIRPAWSFRRNGPGIINYYSIASRTNEQRYGCTHMRAHLCTCEVREARNNGKSVRARGALTRVAALQRDVGRHRHERGRRGRGTGPGEARDATTAAAAAAAPLPHLSPCRTFHDLPNHPFPCGARTPSPGPSLPPATEPDRRTTGSSSSSPLIRLSRYRHRRPGNPLPPPPASRPPAAAAVAPSPRGPLLRFWLTADPLSSDPRGRIQPRYPYPPDCHT